MYAILDIETTGGQYNEEGITEIAIYRFDGHEVTDQFISLINPEIPIQPYVVKLTGISNAMLKTAPKFYEVAKRIIEITSDCIIVAHNALFDYRILRTEFKRLGYDFQSPTLCTVELAQKLIPGQPAYSLGKLVRGLGIPVADRHRATGDAMATLKLFKLLLSKDTEKNIVKEFIKTEVEKGIEPKLMDIVESLPSTTGIYYVHREDGTLLFIGKSRNIRKSVNQHFVGSHRVSKKITAEVFSVTYEETGSELIAAMKEREEIVANRPLYNKVPKRQKHYPWTLTTSVDADGYQTISLEKIENRKTNGYFSSWEEGRNALTRAASDYGLCLSKLGLWDTIPCANHPEKCDGACVKAVSPDEYNQRVMRFLARFDLAGKNLAIIDKGRRMSERSAILIENGIVKGYAFFDLNYQVNNPRVLHNILVPLKGQTPLSGIASYLIKNRRPKIVTFL